MLTLIYFVHYFFDELAGKISLIPFAIVFAQSIFKKYDSRIYMGFKIINGTLLIL